MAASVEFQTVSKRYDSIVAVDNASFLIPGGSFFSILGPSGCGKTTLLRLVAGFEKPDSGRIYIDQQDVTTLPPNKRPVNTVFQNYALFPTMSVRENIEFGLRMEKCAPEKIRRDVESMLHLIQLEAHADKMPIALSGGQKQRVAIARALIKKPKVLLLDEPLAALDLKLRQKMLLELDLIHDEVGITFIFITHDQSEAMAVSDQIAVLHQGKVEQIGKPTEIYETPKSSFVAAFIGDTNFLDGIVSNTTSSDYSRLEIQEFPSVLCFNDKKISVGELIHLSVRPEKLQISREFPTHLTELHNCVEGIVDDVVYKGDHTKYWVVVQGYRLGVIQQHSRFLFDSSHIEWKDTVWVSWHADDSFFLERYNESDERMMENSFELENDTEEASSQSDDQKELI